MVKGNIIKIEMKGYATRTSKKAGETDDGRQDYTFSRTMHLSGELIINDKTEYIDEHTSDFKLPFEVKKKNENRMSTKDDLYVTVCTIVALRPLLNQAGEPRRSKGFDQFEAEVI